MAERPVYLTPEGLKDLEKELTELKINRRKEIAVQINQAKELGTTVNNAEYDDAKREQSFVEGRIKELESILRAAKVVPHETKSGRVNVGSQVKLTASDGQLDEYMIVGSAEANPLEDKISNESPVGQALMGKKVGDKVQVKTPSGVITYTISSVS